MILYNSKLKEVSTKQEEIQVSHFLEMSRLSNDDYKPRTGEKDEDDLDEGHSTIKSAKFGQQLIYLTRALVKNNIVG